MKQMDQKESLVALHEAGFTAFEIKRLYQLKRAYVEHTLDQVSVDLNRLEFARWLVVHGRLSDYIL